MSLVSKAFSDIVTFSRSSNATRIGPTGRVEYAPHNLILQSQDFSTTWENARSSEQTNVTTAPDGTVTADKLIDDTTAADTHFIGQAFSKAGVSLTYTASIFAKYAGRNLRLLIDPSSSGMVGGASGANIDVNLETGAIINAAATFGSGWSNASGSITSVGNGWFRVVLTVTSNTNSNLSVKAYSLNAANSSVYTGDGTSGIYLWGAQLSVGPYPLDYTPTTTAAVYGPRFDYDPVTLAARGLLVEESRSNLVTYSEQFNNAAWTKNNCTVTANSVVSPDGTVSADTATTTSTTSSVEVYGLATISAGASYTFSCFVKAGTHSKAVLRSYNGGITTTPLALFDITNKSVIATYGNVTATSVQDYGNGWLRCIMTFTSTGTSANPQVNSVADTYTVSTDYNYVSTMNSNGSIYLWGAQLEAGSFATSYIPTIASTVTRSADVASVNTLSPWMNQTEGTLFAEASFIAPTSSSSKGIATLVDNSSGNESISIFGISSSNVKQEVLVGGASQASFTLGYSTAIKAATAYKANDTNAAVNGVAGTTDTSCSIPTVAKLQLGGIYNGTSFQMNGWLSRVAFFPRRLTNAELAALTA